MSGQTGLATQPATTIATSPDEGRRRLELRSWPLFAALGPIGALPTAPGLAREFTVLILGGWGIAGAGDVAEVSKLIVSELSTNVVQAATDGDGCVIYRADGRLTQMWLRLMSDRERVRIEVWDNLPPSAGVPVLRHPMAGQEHGRGLGLVDSCSRAWGWSPIQGPQTKFVWALLDAR